MSYPASAPEAWGKMTTFTVHDPDRPPMMACKSCGRVLPTRPPYFKVGRGSKRLHRECRACFIARTADELAGVVA